MTGRDPALQRSPHSLDGARWLSGPALMLMLCFSGMMTGLAIDLQSISPIALVTLCLGTHSLTNSIMVHSTVLPATNLFMLAGGVVAAGISKPVAARWSARYVGFYLGCCIAMLAGMFFGEWFGPRLAAVTGLPWDLSAMVGMMATGMTLGMAVASLLGRIAGYARLPREVSPAGQRSYL